MAGSRADRRAWAGPMARRRRPMGRCNLHQTSFFQGLRDGWIADEQKPRLFRHPSPALLFLLTRLTSTRSRVSCRARWRSDRPTLRIRRAWAEISTARAISASCPPRQDRAHPRWAAAASILPRTSEARFVILRQIQPARSRGSFSIVDAETGLHAQLPLVSSGGAVGRGTPCRFRIGPEFSDWPNKHLPCRLWLPEPDVWRHVTIPAFYGQRSVTGLGIAHSFYFRYEQARS